MLRVIAEPDYFFGARRPQCYDRFQPLLELVSRCTRALLDVVSQEEKVRQLDVLL
jgi:hypothetical protein